MGPLIHVLLGLINEDVTRAVRVWPETGSAVTKRAAPGKGCVSTQVCDRRCGLVGLVATWLFRIVTSTLNSMSQCRKVLTNR